VTAPAPYTARAAAVLTEAARAEHDFPGWLAAVLCAAAARLGGLDALTEGRAGSWEAALVGQLTEGTAGDGRALDGYSAWAGDAVPPAGLTEAQRATLGQALADAIEWRRPDTTGCRDCAAAAPRLCPDHDADQARALSYGLLAGKLGIEIPS
jgi:hypothetical protein